MSSRLLLLIVAAFVPADAQFELSGPPANPEFYSAMSAIWQQVPTEPPRPAAKPKGNVAELVWEQFQPAPADRTKAADPSKRVAIRYDDNQREVERIESEVARGIESKTVSVYQNGQLESETTQFLKNGKPDGPPAWLRWRYDAEGRVIDFQKGRDDSLENHFLNYRYDSQGRPTGWVYQQGQGHADDFAESTEIKYTGNVVETSNFDQHSAKNSVQIQTLDANGHISDLKVFENSRKDSALKLQYHTRFQYDPHGRVLMEETDPYTVGEGDDYQPYPGKLVVRYDDAAHSREQSFYDSKGMLAFRNLAELDRDGSICSLRVFDSAGKERQESELFPRFMARVPETRLGRALWEVDYDKQGSWVERRRYFYPADGGDRLLMQLARQTIRYR